MVVKNDWMIDEKRSSYANFMYPTNPMPFLFWAYSCVMFNLMKSHNDVLFLC
jgi:hypothetical protein